MARTPSVPKTKCLEHIVVPSHVESLESDAITGGCCEKHLAFEKYQLHLTVIVCSIMRTAGNSSTAQLQLRQALTLRHANHQDMRLYNMRRP